MKVLDRKIFVIILTIQMNCFSLFTLYFLLSTQFMSVDEIKPGMTGYGLSTFKGTKIDTFQVEIIDIIHNQFPKIDMILARISGKVVDTAGVISGMSGSPIYIYDQTTDNRQAKLIGALALGYTIFAKEHLTGITPIHEMLNPPSTGYAPPGEFSPIKIPMNCPGLPDEMFKELETQFPCFNLLKGQGSAKIIDDSTLPEPGSPLGIVLVQGDVTWAGIGTCTYKEGNKVWGFGHPFATLGKTELPMTAGYVYSVVPSSFHSYKMSTPTRIIGTIKNDNRTGISGVIGEIPDLIEFNMKIKSALNEEKFHYQLIKEKIFLPLLFSSLTFYSIYTGFKGTGDLTAEVDLEIKGSPVSDLSESERNFHFKNFYTGTPKKITASISKVFNSIQNNPFQRINIEEISLNLVTNDTIKLAKIEELWADQKEVIPNDTLNLLISLSTYREGSVRKQIPILIPSWAKKGELWIKVENGATDRNKTQHQLRTIDELTKWLAQAPKNNELVITLSQKGHSGWISGEKFQALPPSKASFIKGEEKNEIYKLRIPTEWVITKEKSIKLEVK